MESIFNDPPRPARTLAVILCLGLVAASVVHFGALLVRAAEVRDSRAQERYVKLYAECVAECRRKWPLAKDIDIYDCAQEMME